MSWAHWASSVALTAANRQQAASQDRPQCLVTIPTRRRPSGRQTRGTGGGSTFSPVHGKDQTGLRGAVGVRSRRDRLTAGLPFVRQLLYNKHREELANELARPGRCAKSVIHAAKSQEFQVDDPAHVRGVPALRVHDGLERHPLDQRKQAAAFHLRVDA